MFGSRFRRARAALIGGPIAALVLTSTLLPVAAAPALAAGPSTTAPATPTTQTTLAPSLIGRWLHTSGDCADFCSNVAQQYQFNQNAQYMFAEQHRDQYNYDGQFCVDTRLYYEAGTWFTNGAYLYTTPTVAIAEHTNTCDPSNNFRQPVSLQKTYFQWQVFTESNGQPGLVISNPGNPAQRTIYNKVALT
jgi:hypothetical protein